MEHGTNNPERNKITWFVARTFSTVLKIKVYCKISKNSQFGFYSIPLYVYCITYAMTKVYLLFLLSLAIWSQTNCLCREMRAKFTEHKLMLTAAVSAGFQTVNQVNRIPAFDSHRTGFPLHHINKEPKKVEKTTLFFPDMILIQK